MKKEIEERRFVDPDDPLLQALNDDASFGQEFIRNYIDHHEECSSCDDETGGERGAGLSMAMVISTILGCVMTYEPTETSKQPIRTCYLDHVTGYQPIRDQYFLIQSVPSSC
eukprot:sb/3477072/